MMNYLPTISDLWKEGDVDSITISQSRTETEFISKLGSLNKENNSKYVKQLLLLLRISLECQFDILKEDTLAYLMNFLQNYCIHSLTQENKSESEKITKSIYLLLTADMIILTVAEQAELKAYFEVINRDNDCNINEYDEDRRLINRYKQYVLNRSQ